MEYSYPLLHKVFDYYKQINKTDLSNIFIYSCQHLLAPQYEMYKMFVDFGIKPSNIIALGKIYSSNTSVIDDLRNLGVKVYQPEFTNISFDEEHRANCVGVINQVANDTKNIILDDGGFLISVAKGKSVYFGVEQTSSGFRKLENIDLNFPVFNVARSETKLTQESPIIARIIFERLKSYIAEKSINSPKILVIGLGPVGDSIFQVLDSERYSVIGFDVEKTKEDLIRYLTNSKPDIIIGATGTSLFDESDLITMESDHLYHFISVSSSDREFPVVNFRINQKIHDDVKYKNFIFVNNGFPITFKGNRYESTPVEIEKTIGLLMGSVLHGITFGIGDNIGVIEVPQQLELLLNS